MPQRLPISVVLRGLALRTATNILLAIRYAVVLFCWVWLLPLALAQPFRLYFGDWLWGSALIVDPMVGVMMMLASVFGVIGLKLLQEYMEAHHLFDFLNLAPEPEVAEEDVQDEEPVDPSGETNPNEPGSWLEQVTPREYRAFLRRREYHREKNERLRVKQHEVQSQRNADILRMIDVGLGEAESMQGNGREDNGWETESSAAGLSMASLTEGRPLTEGRALTERTNSETFHPYNLETATAYGYDYTDVNTAVTATRRAPTAAPGVVFRESFRCRICQRRSCVSREHVVQSSIQQRVQRDPLLVDPPAFEPAQPLQQQRANNFPLFNWIRIMEHDPNARED